MSQNRDHTPNTADSYIPVPLAPRRNGWTAERQRVFLAALAETGSVALASARAGMAKRSAYRLRARPDAAAFADRWDAALHIARARDRARRSLAPGGVMPSLRQMFQAIRACRPDAFARSNDARENCKQA